MSGAKTAATGRRRPLICPICQMTFLDQVTLNEHKKKDHSIDPEPPVGVG
jgi:hypothetical protein